MDEGEEMEFVDGKRGFSKALGEASGWSSCTVDSVAGACGY
jgi:hypothetical protein